MATIIGTACIPAIPQSIRWSTSASHATSCWSTPAERPGVPTTSPAIMNRMQEISSNTSLIREMRMIASYNKLIEQGRMGGGKRMLMHVIEAEEFIRAFSWSSRLNADWDFLQHIYNMGRARADQWLEANFDRLGIDSTVDLDSRYF
jgi:NTE family protein